jgi:hypothetical protein
VHVRAHLLLAQLYRLAAPGKAHGPVAQPRTLTLPDAEPAARMAAANRLLANREAYRRRRIWPAVTNVRAAREVDALLAAGMPFLSGMAVGEAVESPIMAAAWPKTQLPMVGEPEFKRRRVAGPGGL